MIPTLEWTPEGVNFLDQTKLPHEETYVLARDYTEVARAIKDMIVRGAMAIGVSAAMGVALGIERSTATTIAELDKEVEVICETLAKTRPTAVNLFWGIAQVRDLYNELAAKKTPIPEIKREVVALAKRLYDEDIANLRRLGAFGAELLPEEGHGADALQCRRAGGVRLRLGAGRDPRGGRGRQEDRCLRGRDAAVQPGHAADGVGAAEGQHSDDADLRQHGRRTSWVRGGLRR